MVRAVTIAAVIEAIAIEAVIS